MLLATEGYFEDRKAYKKRWNEIIDEIENSDEALEGEPEHLRFRTPEETAAL